MSDNDHGGARKKQSKAFSLDTETGLLYVTTNVKCIKFSLTYPEGPNLPIVVQVKQSLCWADAAMVGFHVL